MSETTHAHSTARSQQGRPMPRYDVCECGHVRCVWPSGRTLDWHKPSHEKGAEARKIDQEERTPPQVSP